MSTKLSKAFLTVYQKLSHYARMFVLEPVPMSLRTVYSSIYWDLNSVDEDGELVRDLCERVTDLDVFEMTSYCEETGLLVQNL